MSPVYAQLLVTVCLQILGNIAVWRIILHLKNSDDEVLRREQHRQMYEEFKKRHGINGHPLGKEA